MQGIYRIRNILNDKRYVGSTNDFENGWTGRWQSLRLGKHHNIHLQRAWNKHNEENFVFEIEEEVKGGQKALWAAEQSYLNAGFEAGNLYNMARKAGGGNLGPEAIAAIREWWTPENRAEHSKRNSGKNNPNYGNTGEANPLYGKKRPKEFVARMSEITKKSWTPERQAQLSERMSGENNPNAKSYPAFYNIKTGEFILAGICLAKMCNEHELSEYVMQSLVKGRHKQSRDGWVLNTDEAKARAGEGYIGELYPAFYNVKTGEFIPAGRNLTKLSRDHGLNCTVMGYLARGTTKSSHDGWRLAIPSEIKEKANA